jgi:hypothetical protein
MFITPQQRIQFRATTMLQPTPTQPPVHSNQLAENQLPGAKGSTRQPAEGGRDLIGRRSGAICFSSAYSIHPCAQMSGALRPDGDA